MVTIGMLSLDFAFHVACTFLLLSFPRLAAKCRPFPFIRQRAWPCCISRCWPWLSHTNGWELCRPTMRSDDDLSTLLQIQSRSSCSKAHKLMLQIGGSRRFAAVVGMELAEERLSLVVFSRQSGDVPLDFHSSRPDTAVFLKSASCCALVDAFCTHVTVPVKGNQFLNWSRCSFPSSPISTQPQISKISGCARQSQSLVLPAAYLRTKFVEIGRDLTQPGEAEDPERPR